MSETYTHGHQEPVLRSHRWRTAANSAAYLTGRLEPGMDLLDVAGRGPSPPTWPGWCRPAASWEWTGPTT